MKHNDNSSSDSTPKHAHGNSPPSTPPPPPFPKGGDKPIRNQDAKRIAEEFLRAQWAEYHPMAVRQIVRNCVSIADREIKRAQVAYQIEQTGAATDEHRPSN